MLAGDCRAIPQIAGRRSLAFDYDVLVVPPCAPGRIQRSASHTGIDLVCSRRSELLIRVALKKQKTHGNVAWQCASEADRFGRDQSSIRYLDIRTRRRRTDLSRDLIARGRLRSARGPSVACNPLNLTVRYVEHRV